MNRQYNRDHHRSIPIPPHLITPKHPPHDATWRHHSYQQPRHQPYIHMPQPIHPPVPLLPSTRDTSDISNLFQKDPKAYLMNLKPANMCRAVLTAIDMSLFSNEPRDRIEQLLALADEFLLGIRGDKLSSCVELMNLDEIATFLTTLSSLEHKLTLFDALFSCTRRDSIAHSRELVLCRLVSLAVCAPYPALLDLAAYLMRDQTDTARAIARSLYHDYFQLLPSASKPLEAIYRHSATFSAQLLIAYTKLYPIFQANIQMSLPTPPGGSHSPINPPPLPLMRMIATWMQQRQELCHTRAPQFPDALPLLHQRSSVTHIHNTPLPGIIAWTTLSPLLKGLNSDTVAAADEEELNLYSQIHVNMLSAVHQFRSSPSADTNTTGQCISSEDLSTIVANLIGLAGYVGIAQPGSEHYSLLHDSIDRIAQSIQVSLFADLLNLSKDDLASIAATLPRNSLLDIVIEHHTHT